MDTTTAQETNYSFIRVSKDFFNFLFIYLQNAEFIFVVDKKKRLFIEKQTLRCLYLNKRTLFLVNFL